MAVRANPFKLFPRQIEETTLLDLGNAPGLPSSTIASHIKTIIKRKHDTNIPSGDYDSFTLTLRFHVLPDNLPDRLRRDPMQMVGYIFQTRYGNHYKIVGASRGDDMDTGRTEFITCDCIPWTREGN